VKIKKFIVKYDYFPRKNSRKQVYAKINPLKVVSFVVTVQLQLRRMDGNKI